jgi:hypothetical protein
LLRIPENATRFKRLNDPDSPTLRCSQIAADDHTARRQIQWR